jgi:molecular chaperone DnaK
MTVLIPRNTTIPTRKSEIFSTASDNQTSVEVHVLQGERSMARDNRPLGRFHLVGLPPAPRGMPQIDVAFDIDANGIVSVSATDRATGKEQAITISGASGLSKEDVERMVRDAQAHAADDAGRRETIEARNRADALIYSVETTYAEHKARLGAHATEIGAALEAAKAAVKGEDRAAIQAATDRLQRASHAMAKALYQAPSAAQASRAGEQEVKDGEVIDAEYAETSN